MQARWQASRHQGAAPAGRLSTPARHRPLTPWLESGGVGLGCGSSLQHLRDRLRCAIASIQISHGDGRTAGWDQPHPQVCKSHLRCAASNIKIHYCCEDFGSIWTAKASHVHRECVRILDSHPFSSPLGHSDPGACPRRPRLARPLITRHCLMLRNPPAQPRAVSVRRC